MARRFGAAGPACEPRRYAVSPLRRASPPSPQTSLSLRRLSLRTTAAGKPTESASWLANRSSHERAKVGGEGRIRTSEAAGATDLQSVAFDRFATSPIPRPHVSVARAHASALTAEGLSFVMSGFAPLANFPADRPRRKPFSGARGAGEGIRTPDRLITNQLLYRTELRQPRQKSICSTCRATAARGRLFLIDVHDQPVPNH